MRICTKDGCQDKQIARGRCRKHYNADLYAGAIKPTRSLFRGTPAERLKHYSRRAGECIVWTGSLSPDGYGKTRVAGVIVGTHRLAYELANGPIPAGMNIDHRCHTPSCINPDHLRLATTKQNAENQKGPTSVNKTGYLGVSKAGGRNKYRAAVKHYGVTRFLGHFDTAEEAAAVVREHRLALFTHNDRDRIEVSP